MPSSNTSEIVIFLTGGTIEMSPQEGAPGVVPGDRSHDLLRGLPAMSGVALRTVRWSSLPSGHMTPELMLKLAGDMDAVLARDNVRGCVVLHGTDLLVETSFMLNMALRSPKPVVTSGAMRHAEELGYDGVRNLRDGVLGCLALPLGREVLVQMASQFFSPMDAVKMDSMSVAPMAGLRHGPVGRVVGDEAHLDDDLLGHRPRLPFEITDASPFVPLLTCWPGMDGTLVRASVEAGARGMVIQGFGAGNIPPLAARAVIEVVETGIPVVLATRCLQGGVWPVYGYEGGAASLMSHGVLPAGPYTATRALLLLKAALGSGYPANRLNEIFR